MKKAVNNMIGKTYMFNSNQHTIKDIQSTEEDIYHVVTDKRTIKVSEEELLEDFLPIDGNYQKLQVYQELSIEPAQLNDLGTILLDNIKKVQEDASYVEQAKSINESAKTLIDLKKTQIEAIKVIRSI